jgi:hypothetical protein
MSLSQLGTASVGAGIDTGDFNLISHQYLTVTLRFSVGVTMVLNIDISAGVYFPPWSFSPPRLNL